MSYEKMKKDFESSNISLDGVKLPKKHSQKAQTLLFLWENKNKLVSKPEAEKQVFQRMGTARRDLQSLRHLGKQDGFNILQGGEIFRGNKIPRGHYVFVGFEKTNRFWNFSRRSETDLDWAQKKASYSNSCATCGEKEGKTHRYTGEVVVLQKGHMDPEKEMNDDNIIPQCRHCNSVAKDMFVFDKYGKVKKMTKQGILARFSKDELMEIINLYE